MMGETSTVQMHDSTACLCYKQQKVNLKKRNRQTRKSGIGIGLCYTSTAETEWNDRTIQKMETKAKQSDRKEHKLWQVNKIRNVRNIRDVKV